MKFKLKVLTPLHIGSGNKYSPFEYILENGILKKYDIEEIIKKAKEKNLLKSLASYFKGNNIYSLNKIFDTNPTLRKAILDLKPEYVIKAEIEREEEIEEFIKSDGKIYVPGSEIKGSIRRALLFHVLKEDKEIFKVFLNELRKVKEKKELKRVNEYIENLVFRGKKNDAQHDILKLLKISDTKLLQPSERNLKVKKIGLFYITSQKQKEFASEVALPGTEFEFSINLSPNAKKIANLLDCHQIIKKLFVDSQNEDIIIERIVKIWKETEKECVKLDPYLVPISESEIFSSINNKERALKIVNFIKHLKEGRKPIVRIGKHEGYLFTTVMAIVKERDRETFEKIFRLSVPKVSGIPNKTRKLTVKEKLPLGFCSLESD